MICADVAWIDYLEGRLPPAEREAVAAHLAGCAACAAHQKRWQALLVAAVRTPGRDRLGCPSPREIAALGTPEESEEVRAHLESCDRCAEEARALIEVDTEAGPEALPPELAHLAGEPSENVLADMGREVLSLVRARLGDTHPLFERWRRAVWVLGGPEPAAGWAFAALESPVEAAEEPLEISVRAGGVELEVRRQGPWVRVKARRGGSPLGDVTVRVEDPLGQGAETRTDIRGEASVREGSAGVRRVVLDASQLGLTGR